MKICNISFDDYANFAHENANALRSVGIECKDLKRVKHPFSYGTESKVATSSEIEREIKKADIVQLFHSDSTWLDYAYSLGKRIFIYHTGTTYRMNPIHCNSIFNGKVEACFTDQCEFIGLGMKNETYIATTLNTDKYKPIEKEVKTPYLVAHYPSNPGVKGTDKIVEMLSNIEVANFTINTDRISHKSQIERMQLCDIYVELFAPFQHGKQYGCFGVTAFEAASLGKIVFTNNSNEKVYSDAYGECALIITNTEKDFISKMEWILQLNEKHIVNLQEQSRNWIIKNHSYKATGLRLKKLLNI